MNTFYLFSILATAAIFTMLALSLNIITGYAGQAMMGIAAFFGMHVLACNKAYDVYHPTIRDLIYEGLGL